MLIDCSLKVTKAMRTDAQGNESKALSGHLGTHFDVMNQIFPLEFTKREGLVFDVSHIRNRDIVLSDIDASKVKAHQFVAFYTGFIEEVEYGTVDYFTQHPQLADSLIDFLLAKKVSIIGIDAAGLRRGVQHTPCDQKCADQGVFVVENLVHLKSCVDKVCVINTYPINFEDWTGLPTRVIAEIDG